VLRFYDPDQGRVLVGGRDVRELDPTWLRGQIATVMQEPTLFSRTVGENIAYGASPAGAEAIAAAASWASADEFIERLPGGFAAPIGDRGVQLSGGQRQRLAIARALLRRPKILILDEATSALDGGLESVVQQALRAIEYHPTTLIIAHRLSTVAHVDRVVVLDQGRIVERGTHDELLRTSARYRQLVQTQLVAL
jgi:ABC-type multidrug transport system fused ATPase/permease subunit